VAACGFAGVRASRFYSYSTFLQLVIRTCHNFPIVD